MSMEQERQPTALLRLRDVMSRTGLGRSTIYRKMACGEFPPRVQISERCIGWASDEIERWTREKIARRDSAS